MHRTMCVLVAVLAVLVSPAAAQQVQVVVPDSGVVQELRLTDGTVYYGHVVGTGDPVRFELANGDVLEIRRARIRSLREVEARVVEGEVWPPDPNATRLLFAPTGRSLEAGQGYLAMYEILLPFFAYGVHDRITLAGGFPLFFGGDLQFMEVFWLAPKVQVVRADAFQAAVGSLSFFSRESGGESAGIVYGVGTFGKTNDRSLTLGIGYGYASSEISNQPVLMVGGETRVSRGVKLLTENWILPQDGVLLGAGPRFFGAHLTADLGLVMPIFGGTDTFVFPLANFVYNW